jgi:thioredoxin-like negative regulator of GroEL
LRPLTKKMLVGAMQTNTPAPKQKFSYDAHADWELSRLLSALDEQTVDAEVKKDAEKLGEIKQFAEACAAVLQTQTESAEVFIQLAERALSRRDYKKIDELADALFARFSVGEMCEIARQAINPAIRALAYEALILMPVSSLAPMLQDPVYYDVARNALEQQAFEYESEEARRFLEQIEFEDDIGGE